jgi:hypothetical protein
MKTIAPCTYPAPTATSSDEEILAHVEHMKGCPECEAAERAEDYWMIKTLFGEKFAKHSHALRFPGAARGDA